MTTKQKTKKTPQKAVVVQTRVNPALREQSDLILNRLGLSTPDAIRIFLEQVVLHRGIPFEVKIPAAADQIQGVPEVVWNEETERKFQSALDSIDAKYGNALKNLAELP